MERVLRVRWRTSLLLAVVMLLNSMIMWLVVMVVSTGAADVLNVDGRAIAFPAPSLVGAGLLIGLWRVRRVALIADPGRVTVRNVWTTRSTSVRDIDGARLGWFPNDWLPWRPFGSVPMLVLRDASGGGLPILASASDGGAAVVEAWKLLDAVGVRGLPARQEIGVVLRGGS